MNEKTELIANACKAFGQRVRKYRELADLTQVEVCKQTGLFRTYVSRIELGNANPSVGVICALAAVLRVQPWELLMDVSPQEASSNAYGQ